MSNSDKNRIYLDYAASTPVCDEAWKAMKSVLDTYGNPGALHTEGIEGARVRDEARSSIARYMGVKASELIFVSGGTEGNNLALIGFFNAREREGKDISTLHLVTSAIEHSSVLETCEELERRGVQVSYVKPDEKGVVRPEEVKAALSKNTAIVSIGLVNGEIGTTQPLHAISKIVKEFNENIVVHTDACQGMYLSLVPQGLGVDLLTLDSTKMYGPRGTGILYIKKGVKLAPIMFGGAHEEGLRPGTENTMLYVGFAAAFDRAVKMRESESERLEKIRANFLERVSEGIPDAAANGTSKQQSPHIANISIPKIDAEYTTLYLDARGVAISTKSACKELEGNSASHVVKELSSEEWRAENTLRFSFGTHTKEKDMATVVELLEESVSKQRSFKETN